MFIFSSFPSPSTRTLLSIVLCVCSDFYSGVNLTLFFTAVIVDSKMSYFYLEGGKPTFSKCLICARQHGILLPGGMVLYGEKECS